MILCTYQPMDFKFDVCSEYNALDYERRDRVKEKHGTDYIADYTKLLGKDKKPIFCFEATEDVIRTAVKSKFVFPTNPEMFIMFETDDSICYNDVLWNNAYGSTTVDDAVRDDVLSPCDYRMACHIVDCIRRSSVIYTCNMKELVQNGKLYGKARLHRDEMKKFEKVILLSQKWYSIYENKLRSSYMKKSYWKFRQNSTSVPEGRHAVPLQTA